jgi:hypothetical protein
MEDLWNGIFVCCGFTRRGWKHLGGKTRYFFFFHGILTDKRFIFVSLSFRNAEIDFDLGFIVRPTNFSLAPYP